MLCVLAVNFHPGSRSFLHNLYLLVLSQQGDILHTQFNLFITNLTERGESSWIFWPLIFTMGPDLSCTISIFSLFVNKVISYTWNIFVQVLSQHFSFMILRNEPLHVKTNNVAVRPAKTQISLGMCPVWSESFLCAQWVAKGPSFLHADSKDSDQTGRMPRLIWVFAGRTATLLVLTWGGSNCLVLPAKPQKSETERLCVILYVQAFNKFHNYCKVLRKIWTPR